MKDKREIEIGHVISSEKIGDGETVLKVESIREVDGVKRYYVGAEGLQGVHVVLESEVVDHATPEEYQKYLESLKGEVDSEPATEETTPVAPVTELGNENTEQVTEPTTPSVETSSSEPVAPVTDVKTDPAPVAPVQPAAQQQQGNKNQNNKRRV